MIFHNKSRVLTPSPKQILEINQSVITDSMCIFTKVKLNNVMELEEHRFEKDWLLEGA